MACPYYKLGEIEPATPSLELPSAGWFTEDVVEAFRRDAVREAGTMVLDGREYARLVTEDGLDTVLVDPETGEAVAWIPSPAAFGVPTTVVRTQETLADNAENRRKPLAHRAGSRHGRPRRHAGRAGARDRRAVPGRLNAVTASQPARPTFREPIVPPGRTVQQASVPRRKEVGR